MTERLEAMFTSEGLLAAVQSTVLSQVMFVFESLIADCTDKWPLTCHNRHNRLLQYTQYPLTTVGQKTDLLTRPVTSCTPKINTEIINVQKMQNQQMRNC